MVLGHTLCDIKSVIITTLEKKYGHSTMNFKP